MSRQNRQRVVFEGVGAKPVCVEFSVPAQSSDGGLVLLEAVDRRMGLTAAMAEAVRDRRQAAKVEHSLPDLIRERVYGIASGYADCNDAAVLARDPVMKLVCGRSPLAEDETLASQPTLSRFENMPGRGDLVRMAYALTDRVIAAQRARRRGRRVRQITIDMDPTDDPTYGNQQLTFFNGYYDNWCYLPMMTAIQFDGENEQYLVAPVLRPGNAGGSDGALAILKRLVPRLRHAFPGVHLVARMDGAFAAPEVFDWLEREHIEYYVNMAWNSVLELYAAEAMEKARRLSAQINSTARVFTTGQYKAGRWKACRRVLVKAEVVVAEGKLPRDNPRFVITNNYRISAGTGFARYGARGDVENRFKELHYDLDFDQTGCTSFLANQFRNLLTAAAYALYQEIRTAVTPAGAPRPRVSTLRERLVKIGVILEESVRRIVLKAPRAFAWVRWWRKAAFACGALSG